MTPGQEDAEPLPTSADIIKARAGLASPFRTYRHYKGDLYVFLDFAYMDDTREQFVRYLSVKRIGNMDQPSLRPSASFFQDVLWRGLVRPRFMSVADGAP